MPIFPPTHFIYTCEDDDFFCVVFIQDEKFYIGIKRGKKKKKNFFFFVPLKGVKTKGKNVTLSFF